MKRFKLKIVLLFIMCTFGLMTVFAQDYFIKHKITKGETLYSIAEKYGVTVDDIKKANPKAGDFFYTGMTIQIPNKKVYIQVTPSGKGDRDYKYFETEKSNVHSFSPNKYGNTTNIVTSGSINSEDKSYEKWNFLFNAGYGFLDGPKNVRITAGIAYLFTYSFYLGAQIGYNSVFDNEVLGLGLGSSSSESNFINIPLETGYRFMSSNGKWGIIPYAGIGLNIGLKGESEFNGKKTVQKIGGKMGVEGCFGAHIYIYGFMLSGSYHLPLNEKQEVFFGEDSYPVLSLGCGF